VKEKRGTKNCNRKFATLLTPFQASSTKMHPSLIPSHSFYIWQIVSKRPNGNHAKIVLINTLAFNSYMIEKEVIPTLIYIPGVNFINIKCTNFSYARWFQQLFLVTCMLPKQRSYEKFVRLMLMKLTAAQLQVSLVICGLFICNFTYMRLKKCFFFWNLSSYLW